MPLILDGNLFGMQLDGSERVVMSGTFSGSMLVDDRLLVSNVPELREVANTFLAAFRTPSLDDAQAPEVTAEHVPKPMTLEATTAAGAEVFFVPPTSLDAGHAGVSVACSPPPGGASAGAPSPDVAGGSMPFRYDARAGVYVYNLAT